MRTQDNAIPPEVGNAGRALGFAGLLPQAGAVAVLLWAHGTDDPHAPVAAAAAAISASIYAAVILSFLGGIWWGFAMHRGAGQGRLACLAVLPSLMAAGSLVTAATVDLQWSTVALACAILLSLPVDRRLVAAGDAPAGWMGLRIPLSLGLGTLTILAAILAPR